MSSILSSLKIVHAKRMLSTTDPIQFRRAKMLRKLDIQITLAASTIESKAFQIEHISRVRNPENEEKIRTERNSTAHPWWFITEGGKIAIQLRYGNRVLSFTKNRNAIMIDSLADLVETLQKIKQAIHNGELDNEISITADKLRAGFKKAIK